MATHVVAAAAAAAGCLLQVARRKGPDGKLLSMGFGFVETDSEAAAKAAIKALQVRVQLHRQFMHYRYLHAVACTQVSIFGKQLQEWKITVCRMLQLQRPYFHAVAGTLCQTCSVCLHHLLCPYVPAPQHLVVFCH
jgi:hypothetical protein